MPNSVLSKTGGKTSSSGYSQSAWVSSLFRDMHVVPLHTPLVDIDKRALIQEQSQLAQLKAIEKQCELLKSALYWVNKEAANALNRPFVKQTENPGIERTTYLASILKINVICTKDLALSALADIYGDSNSRSNVSSLVPSTNMTSQKTASSGENPLQSRISGSSGTLTVEERSTLRKEALGVISEQYATITTLRNCDEADLLSANEEVDTLHSELSVAEETLSTIIQDVVSETMMVATLRLASDTDKVKQRQLQRHERQLVLLKEEQEAQQIICVKLHDQVAGKEEEYLKLQMSLLTSREEAEAQFNLINTVFRPQIATQQELSGNGQALAVLKTNLKEVRFETETLDPDIPPSRHVEKTAISQKELAQVIESSATTSQNSSSAVRRKPVDEHNHLPKSRTFVRFSMKE